ncbi:phosphatase PAP2 family protein [Sphingobacterium alimentarium]|nr:phosphatase PAP2 family protein [Sphingobacterium alimentarium]
MLTEPHYIDVHISEEIQEKQNGFLDSFMKAVSWFGRIRVSAVLVGCSALCFLLLKRKKDALLMLSTLISGGIAWVLKTLINRPRPTKDFISILEETHYQSFPSGHVLFYTAFFGAFIFILLRTINKHPVSKIIGMLVCLAMIFLGAVSRVYLGAHWFTDVLGGFLAGLIYLLIAGNIYFGSKKT